MPGFTSTSARRLLDVTTTATGRSGWRTHFSSRGDVEPFNLSDLASHLWPLSSSYESKKQVCILIFGLQDNLDTGKHWFRFVSAISFFFCQPVSFKPNHPTLKISLGSWLLELKKLSWPYVSNTAQNWRGSQRPQSKYISVFSLFWYWQIRMIGTAVKNRQKQDARRGFPSVCWCSDGKGSTVSSRWWCSVHTLNMCLSLF